METQLAKNDWRKRMLPEIVQAIKDRYRDEVISKRKLARTYGLTIEKLDIILSEL